ncbi:MAG: chemotaxis protein CheA [Methylococcaceae bacterium]
MNNLLEQFLSEARDFLQGIAEKLMQLENDPNSTELMVELFRFVHTLKGNSGLFDFPEMTRVLHASEDLMDAVRNGRVSYSQTLADQLLEAMDFVSALMDEIELTGKTSSNHVGTSTELTNALRALLNAPNAVHVPVAIETYTDDGLAVKAISWSELPLMDLPESTAMGLHRCAIDGETVLWLQYTPEPECFFKGEDPFFLVRQIPDVAWRHIILNNTASTLAEMDVFSSQLVFQLLTIASTEELDDLLRYVPDQIHRVKVPALAFVKPSGNSDDVALDEDFIINILEFFDGNELETLTNTINTMLELSSPDLWSSSALRWVLHLIETEPDNKPVQRILLESLRTQKTPDWSALTLPDVEPSRNVVASPVVNVNISEISDTLLVYFNEVIDAQKEILSLPASSGGAWSAGRLKAVGATLIGCYRAVQRANEVEHIEAALQLALTENSPTPLLIWLDNSLLDTHEPVLVEEHEQHEEHLVANHLAAQTDAKSNRRPEEIGGANIVAASKTLKVDQDKIDRLMNLIGEMVVAKNALPYLANRAETVFGVRELSREIKAQYAVINRVAEEMQDTIMQVRMMPVSFIFQRFPRMVRDISRKLGKEVELVLEGEATEADKNIIEALSDPLIHIVRNSLDHGLEMPEVRLAAGKFATGKLLIRASQESDRVLIEIIDDGKGIDPDVIKQKAYEKGLIDESTFERISDQDAVNLVFAAGFSTADVISDLSGRGVGMDVVRSAVEKVNGTVGIESERGKGTRLFLSLPLSMAVTNVMIIESNTQIFGVPMDMVVETVRVPRAHIRTIKQKQTTVLRGRIVPLLSLNDLLAKSEPQLSNEDDEFATLIVRVHGEHVGILVDDFRETVDIILKPMTGILGGLPGYSGAALLGDGSVLMVLNPRELI